MAVRTAARDTWAVPASRKTGLKGRLAVLAAILAAVIAAVILAVTMTGGAAHVPAPDGRTAALERLHQDAATAPAADAMTSALQRMHADAATP